MKKLFAIAIVIIIAVTLFSGCGAEKVKFTATVQEGGENTILVVPAEGSNELNSSDLIVAHISDKTKIYNAEGKKTDITAIEAGMTVEITYNGAIAESYPAQIGADVIRIVEAAG